MKRKIEMKFITCPGSNIHTHYEAKFNGTRVELVVVGTTDIQKEIESYAKYTDLHYMLHRLSVGDRSVLCSKVPIYGDFSGLSSNPVDAINIVHSAESAFGQLSLDERANYNNDYRAWLAAVLSGSVVSKHPDKTGSGDPASVNKDPDKTGSGDPASVKEE